jgi:lysophospholipase L1-like esterase
LKSQAQIVAAGADGTSDDPVFGIAPLFGDVNDEVEAIAAELGANPSGPSATVAVRLDALDSTVSGKAETSHAHAASAITSGTIDAARLPNASDGVKGAVTPPGGTSNFYRADGSWAAPPGGSGSITSDDAAAFRHERNRALHRFYKDFSDTSKACNVLLLGDSNVEATGLPFSGTAAAANALRWSAKIGPALRAARGQTAGCDFAYVASHYDGSLWTNPYTETGTAAANNATGAPIRTASFKATTKRVYTLPAATRIVLRYGGSGGRWRLNDAGAWTNLSTATGYAGAVQIYNATAATQTVAVDNGNGGTDDSFVLLGFDVFNGDEAGARVINHARAGQKAATVLSAGDYASVRAAWGSYQPSLIVIQYGGNEAREETSTPAQLKTNIETVIADMKAAVVAAGGAGGVANANPSFLILTSWDITDGTPLEPWDNYRAKMWEIQAADPDHVCVLDQTDLIQEPLTSGTDSWWATGDYIHVKPEGHTHLAREIAYFLGIAPPATPLVVADEGTGRTFRPVVNFIGPGVAAVDNIARQRTDVSVYGPWEPAPAAGHMLAPPHQGTTSALGPGQLRFGRVYLEATTYAGLTWNVTTFNAASTVRAAVFESDGNGLVGAKVAATEVSQVASTNGTKNVDFTGGNWTPPSAGFYWLGIGQDGAGATLQAVSLMHMSQLHAQPGFPAVNAGPLYDLTWTTGTLPASPFDAQLLSGDTTLMFGVGIRKG